MTEQHRNNILDCRERAIFPLLLVDISVFDGEIPQDSCATGDSAQVGRDSKGDAKGDAGDKKLREKLSGEGEVQTDP